MSDIIRDLQLPRCPRPHPSLPSAPRDPPTPLSSHPRARGPADSTRPPGARPAPARTKLAPAAAGAPRGLHAGLGPRRLGDRGWQARALLASYLPRLGRRSGEGALPEKSGTPVSPGPCVRLRAPARARVNPFAAASCRSHPRSTLPPPPPPPARSPPPPAPAPSRCPAPSPGPALRRGSSQPPTRPAAGRGLPGDWRLGRAASPPSPEGRTRAPRAPPSPSPLTSSAQRLPPRIAASESGVRFRDAAWVPAREGFRGPGRPAGVR